MSAYSESFPWRSYYGNYNFFENRMDEHTMVTSLSCLEEGVYELKLYSGETLRVFICECYAYGIAEYTETINNIGRVDAVVINSNWCGYSLEAKRHCRDERVGLFNIKDFMAALRIDEVWSYLSSIEQEHFEEEGWI